MERLRLVDETHLFALSGGKREVEDEDRMLDRAVWPAAERVRLGGNDLIGDTCRWIVWNLALNERPGELNRYD